MSEQALPVHKRPPQPAAKDAARVDYDRPATAKRRARPSDAGSRAAAAACSPADFTGRTGSALVSQIKGSTVDCINSLFSLSGSDAYNAFREAQMASVAYAVRDGSPGYPGNPSTGMPQLVLYLRAGYYVQWYDTSVGTYRPALQTAIRSALDAFFANARAWDVTDANGETLAEAVTLIDSAQENARYLFVVNRLLTGFNSSYTSSWYMLNAVNNVYTVLFPEATRCPRSSPPCRATAPCSTTCTTSPTPTPVSSAPTTATSRRTRAGNSDDSCSTPRSSPSRGRWRRRSREAT
ncbi:M9 family metallopeptidase N-terminal domain-containing protein [Micromonospora sp. BRA006-A]|nr:M9 family metallopeptidase N-terminal domain-containing protein [Micromonospora sp. BRA006-A]